MLQSETETRQILDTDGATIVFVIREHDLDRDWQKITEWLKKNVDSKNYRAGYMSSLVKKRFDIPEKMQAFYVQLAFSEDSVMMRLIM